jgi:hypothetical protein
MFKLVEPQVVMAVSSFKPFAESPEIARNQIRAFESWLGVFDSILYFGPPEPRLASAQTVFIRSGCPPIRLLVLAAALAHGPACLLNADIVLAPHAREVFCGALAKNDAAASFRFEFDPKKAFDQPRRVDNGLDVFAAHPHVWKRLWREIPDQFILGKPVWDSWCWAWFGSNTKFVDVTATRCVFHPRHTRR